MGAPEGVTGLPPESLLSIQVGHWRRQFRAEAARRTLEFPQLPANAKRLEVQAFRQTGSKAVHVSPDADHYLLALSDGRGPGQDASRLRLRIDEAAPAVPAPERDAEAMGRRRVAMQEAEGYLSRHGVLEHLRAALADVAASAPADPFAHMGRLARQRQGRPGDVAGGAAATAAPPPEWSPSPPHTQAPAMPAEEAGHGAGAGAGPSASSSQEPAPQVLGPPEPRWATGQHSDASGVQAPPPSAQSAHGAPEGLSEDVMAGLLSGVLRGPPSRLSTDIAASANSCPQGPPARAEASHAGSTNMAMSGATSPPEATREGAPSPLDGMARALVQGAVDRHQERAKG